MSRILSLALSATLALAQTHRARGLDLISSTSTQQIGNLDRRLSTTSPTSGAPRCHNSQFPITDGIQNVIRSGAVPAGTIIQALVDLLQTEKEKAETSFSEDYLNYLGDVVVAVGALGDEKTMPVLYKVVDSGNVPEDALARLGQDSLIAASTALGSNEDGYHRAAVLRVVRKMAERGICSGSLIGRLPGLKSNRS